MVSSGFHVKLNYFRQVGQFSDVNIRVQEKCFPCHRIVLASASGYFEAMFGSCFKEKYDHEIVLQDIPAEAFEDILTAVYTGQKCNINVSNVHNLIHTSLFLRIRSIEESCAEFILKNLSSIHDHIDIFMLVRAINITTLTDAVSTFIIKNFKFFYSDERFMGMPFDDLKFLLDKWVLDKLPFKHENLLLDLLIRWVHYAPDERRKYFNELVEVVNFERISAEYIAFMLKYFKNLVEISNFESTSTTNVTQMIKESELNIDSLSTNPLGIQESRNNLLLKERIIKYFTNNERSLGYSEDVMPPPFQEPKYYKSEFGLHVYLEYRWKNQFHDAPEPCLTNSKVFSFNKYKPDWFLSGETNAWHCCSNRYTVSRQSADLLYSLEIYHDELNSLGYRQSFCTYSSIDMSEPSRILTPPPITSNKYSNICATNNNIFLYRPLFSSYRHCNVPKDDYTVLELCHYNCEVDKWFPVQKPFEVTCNLVADDNLVYLFGPGDSGPAYNQVQAYDHRAARWIKMPSRPKQYNHDFDLMYCKSCTLGGKIYFTCNCGEHELYDPKAGKWKLMEPLHIQVDAKDYFSSRFDEIKMIPFENMLWCILASSNPQHTYKVATWNPVSEKWSILDSLNEIILEDVRMMEKMKGGSFYHEIKDVVIFKTH